MDMLSKHIENLSASRPLDIPNKKIHIMHGAIPLLMINIIDLRAIHEDNYLEKTTP